VRTALETGVQQKAFFKRLKHQSSVNFVWPAIKKWRDTLWCRPRSVLHIRYANTKFLFWPLQLSQSRSTLTNANSEQLRHISGQHNWKVLRVVFPESRSNEHSVTRLWVWCFPLVQDSRRCQVSASSCCYLSPIQKFVTWCYLIAESTKHGIDVLRCSLAPPSQKHAN